MIALRRVTNRLTPFRVAGNLLGQLCYAEVLNEFLLPVHVIASLYVAPRALRVVGKGVDWLVQRNDAAWLRRLQASIREAVPAERAPDRGAASQAGGRARDQADEAPSRATARSATRRSRKRRRK